MAIAGLLIGIVAGLITAGIAFFAFGLSLWVCLAIYSFVGALSTLSATFIAYFLRNSLADSATDQERAVS